jgi:hypothetical protein
MNETYSAPPPLPSQPAPGGKKNNGELFAGFGEQFAAAEGGLTFLRVIDALLKRPGQIAHAIMHGDIGRTSLALFAIIMVCMGAYGALMATFSGGPQLWVVPLKVWLGYLFSALLCLPSLYIFVCLSGGRLSLAQIAALLLQSLALSALLLVGFAPVMWIFSQSTSAIGFMGFLHLLFWLVSISFALRLLGRAIGFINQGKLSILRVWGVIFILVVFQMSTFLRPLVGEFNGYHLEGKKFFCAHWFQMLNGQ